MGTINPFPKIKSAKSADVLFFLPLILLTTLGCHRADAGKGAPLPTTTVRLASGSAAAEGGWVPASLQRADQATLSTRLAGMVKRVLVAEGSRVAAGQLLLELEAGDLLGQLRAAESAREAARAHHQRLQALVQKGAATPSELEQAAAQRAAAEGAVAAVQGQLAFAQIRAPFAGTVQRRDVQPGAFAGPGQPLLTLEGAGALELTATLSEAEAQGLKVGAKVPFEAEGRKGEALVTALAAGGDPLTHRQALRARVIGKIDLRSGAFGRIRVPAAASVSHAKVASAFRIEERNLVVRGELRGVFVAEGGKAHLRWLSLGERGGGWVEVKAGLEPHESLIADPKALQDGQPIAIK